MPRGVPHAPELRAQVVAAVATGASVREVAARFNLDKGLVSRWAAGDATVATARAHVRSPEVLADLIFDLITAHVHTIDAQLSTVAAVDYVERQSAADVAELLVTERDTLLRLLAGLRPVVDEPDQPQLEAAQPPEADA
jgi:hypothetical protein